jgi:hypothetical protein
VYMVGTEPAAAPWLGSVGLSVARRQDQDELIVVFLAGNSRRVD